MPAPLLQPPVGSAFAVFERDAELGQRVANLVGGGEVLVLAGVGAHLDQQLHQLAGQLVVAAGGLAGGLRNRPSVAVSSRSVAAPCLSAASLAARRLLAGVFQLLARRRTCSAAGPGRTGRRRRRRC